MENNQQPVCQSCGMPLTAEYAGTNADGSASGDYCVHCFKDGAFTRDLTMAGMIDINLEYLDEFNRGSERKFTRDEARAAMFGYFPSLKRWRG